MASSPSLCAGLKRDVQQRDGFVLLLCAGVGDRCEGDEALSVHLNG